MYPRYNGQTKRVLNTVSNDEQVIDKRGVGRHSPCVVDLISEVQGRGEHRPIPVHQLKTGHPESLSQYTSKTFTGISLPT